MNPLVAAILPTLINLAEHLIQAEGPVVIKYLEEELGKLKSRYPGNIEAVKTDLGGGNH